MNWSRRADRRRRTGEAPAATPSPADSRSLMTVDEQGTAPVSRASADAANSASVPAGGADDDRLPSFSEQLADQLGGVRGLVESGIPVLVFVVANILWALRPAIIVAAA